MVSLRRYCGVAKGSIISRFRDWEAADPLDLDVELLNQLFPLISKFDKNYYEYHYTIVTRYADTIDEEKEEEKLFQHAKVVIRSALALSI